jgi:hypothetical protein
MNGVITLGAQMIFNIFKKMNNNDKQPELRTNVNWTNYYNSNYSKSIDYESNDKKQDYEIKRDAIAKMEGITEAQRSGLLFGN